MQKPQNGLTKRKGPTWCNNVRKQIFFRFRYLITAKKIYHALMVVFLIFYPRLTRSTAHMEDARGLSQLCGWDTGPWLRRFHHLSHPAVFAPGDTAQHCWRVLKPALALQPQHCRSAKCCCN